MPMLKTITVNSFKKADRIVKFLKAHNRIGYFGFCCNEFIVVYQIK